MRGGPNTLQHWEEYADERENKERDVVPAVSVLEMQLMVEHTVHFTLSTQLAHFLACKGPRIRSIEVQMSTFVNKVLN